MFNRSKKDSGKSARDLTMRQVLSVKKTRSFPSWKQWKQLPTVLTHKEKRTVRSAFAIIGASLLIYTGMYVTAHRIDIPAVGGEYTEGLVGEPQLINPLYSISSDVDHDLVSLVYSGLMKWDANEGFVPDLAESLQVNEDGTVYTLKIRDNAVFHNGDDVRARDVVFTINAIQNPSYRSPLADNFSGVTIVQEDDKTVSFILDDPFAPFTQQLTVGILPASLWAEILPQNAPLAALNLQPIGSGPYAFAEFAKDKRGSIRTYTLTRNDAHYAQAPYIETLTFKFYPDTLALHEALANRNIEGASMVEYAQRAEVLENKNVTLEEPFLPRPVILFFNEDLNSALEDLEVRQAIAQSIDKEAIVTNVYENGARVIHGPLLPGSLGYDETLTTAFDPANAEDLLDEAGYERTLPGVIRDLKDSLKTSTSSDTDEEEAEEEPTSEIDNLLTFTLTTVDVPDMRLVAEGIKSNLEAVGIGVTLNVVPAELMNTQIIGPRNFELLLAPILQEADPDPYMFWHSSQTKENGLNLAGYSNEDVDELIETGRTALTDEERAQAYTEFQTTLAEDLPAVYLYQSTYGYAIASKINHPDITQIASPSDRFGTITQWYIRTKKALR